MILINSIRLAFAIDFFEIHNPKFVPVKVGLVSSSQPEVVAIQNVYIANLEKVIYFKIVKGLKGEFEKNKEVFFVIEIDYEKNINKLFVRLWIEGKNPFVKVFSIMN